MKTSLLVLLSLLIFTGCSPASKKAQSQTLPEKDVMTLITSLSPRDISTASQVDSDSLSQPLQEILHVAAQRRTDLAGQNGWLHIYTRNTQSQPDPLSPFAPGLEQFDQDQWLYLDRNGYVQKAVRKLMDGSGNTLQISVLKSGLWFHLTLGAQSQVGSPTRFDPNYGFDELADRLVQQGGVVNKSLLYKDCWYQGEKYTITDGQYVHEAVYDTGYRELRSIKTWLVASNGNVSLVDSLEILLEERVPQPPADVLVLFSSDA